MHFSVLYPAQLGSLSVSSALLILLTLLSLRASPGAGLGLDSVVTCSIADWTLALLIRMIPSESALISAIGSRVI